MRRTRRPGWRPPVSMHSALSISGPTYFFMTTHLKAFPRVCPSSVNSNEAAESVEPGSYTMLARPPNVNTRARRQGIRTILTRGATSSSPCSEPPTWGTSSITVSSTAPGMMAVAWGKLLLVFGCSI